MDGTIGSILPWLWIILALAFCTGEIFTTGVFLICFGFGAAIAALFAFAGVPLTWQMAVFVLFSGVAVLFARRFADSISGSPANPVGIDRVLGKTAVVLQAIEATTGRGLVRVEREEWSAISASGAPIPAGSTVEVLAVHGAHLIVRWVAGPPVQL
jgi:inner membrane protein